MRTGLACIPVRVLLVAETSWAADSSTLGAITVRPTIYAAFDDTRLYDYPSLADLQGATAGPPGGFFVDQGASRIYVMPPWTVQMSRPILEAAAVAPSGGLRPPQRPTWRSLRSRS